MTGRTKHFALVAVLFVCQSCVIAEDQVHIRVVDVGAGHCAVVKMPGDHYMIYDAGFYNGVGEQHAIDTIKEMIPEDSVIDLLVLSHSDADHLGVVDEICDQYEVKRILRSGFKRTTTTWTAANNAIKAEKEAGAIDINLRYFEYPPGATYRFGDVFVTMVCGFHKPPSDWDIKGTGEKRNAGSIVVRLQYADKSVLFTGDTVGRHIGDSTEVCLAAEKFMVHNSSVITIDSDVMIAPHHGGDNGSSTKFIQAVSPKFVIFPAGSKYDHPQKTTAERYLMNGVALADMYRTDLGDDESDGDDDKEWNHGRIAGNSDPAGDDDVDIIITKSSNIEVNYRSGR